MKPELVIFDCDGVLVDSERIANRVFCEMLNDIGLAVTLEDMFEQFVGLSMPQCEALITRLHGKPPTRAFIDAVNERTAKALLREVTPIEGINTVLDNLALPFCVASSGAPEKIHLSLGKTGLLPLFEGRIYSVTMVEKPKPAPDIFLHAASEQCVAPEHCVVIEDSPTGVKAAVAAGMTVLGFAANTPRERLEGAGAHHVFSHMRELPSLLNR